MEKSLIQSFDLARFGEEEACRFLKAKGLKILDRNYRAAAGELDIVARRDNTIVFVEVKARMDVSYAQPWESVGYRKRNKMKAAAKCYIREKRLREQEFRFDVISIAMSDALKPQIEWIQNAF